MFKAPMKRNAISTGDVQAACVFKKVPAMDEPHTEVLSLREENARLLAEVRALQQAGTAAKEASAAKTRFLAMMSHEIRTPLSGIIGLADLLALGRLDQEQRAYNQAIRGAGASLICLLDEILDLSRAEAGHLDL